MAVSKGGWGAAHRVPKPPLGGGGGTIKFEPSTNLAQ